MAQPAIGQWYQRQDRHSDNVAVERFAVVDVDAAGDLQVQSIDGDILEVTRAEWRQWQPETIEPPENWPDSLDLADPDSYGSGEWSDFSEDPALDSSRDPDQRREVIGHDPDLLAGDEEE